MDGFKNSTKTQAGHNFPAPSARPGYASGGRTVFPKMATGGIMGGGIMPQLGGGVGMARMPSGPMSRPIMPRPRVMPNPKMASMPHAKLAKGGTVGDDHHGDGGGGPYNNPDTGNALDHSNRPYSQVEKEYPKTKELRPGYKKGGLKVKKGALHARMGVKKGKGIATGAIQKDLSKAKKSGNTKSIKQDVFALNARKWHHKAEGGSVSDDCDTGTMQKVAQGVVNKHVRTKPPQGHGVQPKGNLAFMSSPMFGNK